MFIFCRLWKLRPRRVQGHGWWELGTILLFSKGSVFSGSVSPQLVAVALCYFGAYCPVGINARENSESEGSRKDYSSCSPHRLRKWQKLVKTPGISQDSVSIEWVVESPLREKIRGTIFFLRSGRLPGESMRNKSIGSLSFSHYHKYFWGHSWLTFSFNLERKISLGPKCFPFCSTTQLPLAHPASPSVVPILSLWQI